MVPMAAVPIQAGPISYEQSMAMRGNLIQQQKDYQQKILKEKYPAVVALVFAVIITGICAALIFFQVKLITLTSISYYNGEAGLVAAFLGILTVIAIVITGRFSKRMLLYTFDDEIMP